MSDTSNSFSNETLQNIFGSVYGYYTNANPPEDSDSPSHKISFVPLMSPSKTDVGFSYVMYMVLTVRGDLAHFSQNELRKHTRDPEIVKEGIKRYRDTLIPKFVHEDLASGKCKKIILDYSLEGFSDIDWDYVSIIMGVPASKIVWLTSVFNPIYLNSQSDVTVIFNNFWERFISMWINNQPKDGYEQQIQDIKDLKIRPYYGLNYNRIPRDHRLYLLAKLQSLNLLDRTYYSWAGLTLREWDEQRNPIAPEPTDTEIETAYEEATEENYLGGEDDYYALVHVMKTGTVSFPDEDNTHHNQANSLNFDHIKNTYFQIVSETFALDSQPTHSPFLSEKSYKPIASGMPFVIWGHAHSVLSMSKQGYHTFEKWINHDYDSIEDSSQRFSALMREIERLYSFSPEEWSNMLLEMLPHIEENNEKIRGYLGVNTPPLAQFHPGRLIIDINAIT